MVGLPESTRIDEINTAKALVKLKPKMVRIYPVLVIKNTKLEEEYKEGKYQPLSVVQAVEICKDIVRIFADKNIDIINEIPNIENVEPMTHALDDFVCELRDDVVLPSTPIEELLQNCDSYTDREIEVPKVVEE